MSYNPNQRPGAYANILKCDAKLLEIRNSFVHPKILDPMINLEKPFRLQLDRLGRPSA